MRASEKVIDEISIIKISIIKSKYSEYWNMNRNLRFKVFMKENQKLKYLNSGSCHTTSCFKAIPMGVFGRLSKLTLTLRKNMNSRIDCLYDDHAKVL